MSPLRGLLGIKGGLRSQGLRPGLFSVALPGWRPRGPPPSTSRLECGHASAYSNAIILDVGCDPHIGILDRLRWTLSSEVVLGVLAAKWMVLAL